MDTATAFDIDVSLERDVLTSVLFDPARLATVRAILSAEDFARRAHQDVFTSMCRLADRGEPCEIVNVRHDLLRRGAMDVGADYLGRLIEAVPRASLDAIAFHARSIKRAAVRRQMAKRLAEIAAEAQCPHAEAEELVTTIEGLAAEWRQAVTP